METHFAPYHRLPANEIKKQKQSLDQVDHLKNILDASSIVFFIVNEERQIVFSNQHFLEQLNIDSVEQILGLRPGEAMGCVNVKNAPSGCGTSHACKSCGMLGSIQSAFNSNEKVTRETFVTLNGDRNTQLSLEVTASPFYQDGKKYIYFSAIDIEQKKRKELMEKIFFHDVLNLMTSLGGYLEMMEEMAVEDRNRYFPKVKHISNQLLEEITAQQELLKAENNQLLVNAKEVNSLKVLEDVKSKMDFVPMARNKTIVINKLTEEVTISTDNVLLSRVLVNMVKNALEASDNGGVVELCSVVKENSVLFSVHNSNDIPEVVKFQVFKRSVSTKGLGRGLGTYSMKLLGERYLQGKVWFDSSHE